MSIIAVPAQNRFGFKFTYMSHVKSIKKVTKRWLWTALLILWCDNYSTCIIHVLSNSKNIHFKRYFLKIEKREANPSVSHFKNIYSCLESTARLIQNHLGQSPTYITWEHRHINMSLVRTKASQTLLNQLFWRLCC